VHAHPGVGEGYYVSHAQFAAFHAEHQAREVRAAIDGAVAGGEDAEFGEELWGMLQQDTPCLCPDPNLKPLLLSGLLLWCLVTTLHP
jgi:hypothetical protein